MKTSLRCVTVASLVLLAACGSSSSTGTPGTGDRGPSGDDPGTPAGTSSGGFSLRVDRAGLSADLGGVVPANGNVFLVLDVTLANESITPALSEAAPFFTVTTASALVMRTSPLATMKTTTPCRTEVAIAPGGSASCALAFEIAEADIGKSVAYDDAQTHTATAPIPAAHALAPPGSQQPPPRPAAPGAEGTTQWFVLDRLYLGTQRVGTTSPDANAWKDLGYDLDFRITTGADPKACKRPAKSPWTVIADGNGGRDNSFGAHVMATIKSMKSDVEAATNANILGGKGTLLLRLDNVGAGDTAHAQGALFATAPSSPLRLDGSDELPVSSDSVDGSLDRPLVVFPDGYVAGGVWVSGELPGAPFVLPLPLGGGPVAVSLSGGVITVELTGKNGVIAGAGEATTLASAFAGAGCALGGGSGFMLDTFVASADLVAAGRNFQDPARECDAVSIGLGFTMKPAQPPTTIEPPKSSSCE